METIRDEFTYFNEYNKTTEYQRFPAEIYKKPSEENYVGLEQPKLGKEVTTIQTSSPKKSDNNKSNKSNGLLDKIFNSLKTCATVTTVAAVTVVGATAIAPSPSVELNNLLVESTYIEYELSVEELSTNNDYSIVISTTNQDDVQFPVTEDGTYQNKVEGLQPEWEYNLSFVSYDEYLGEVVLFKQTFQTKKQTPPTSPPSPPIEEPEIPPIEEPEEPTLPEYQITITDITIEGLNEVDIHFDTDKLDDTCVVEFLITYQDGEEQLVEINEDSLLAKRVRVEVNGDATFSVTPIIKINDGEESIEFTKHEHTFTENLTAETIVNVSQNKVVFNIKGLLNGATHAEIVDNTTGESVYNQALWGTSITYYYQVGDISKPTYTLYLTTESGQRTSNGYEITFDAEYSNDVQYVFNYKNPGEVGITYNEDGTINVYIQTDFACDDANVFYIVTLGDLLFRSTSPTFSAIGLPDETHTLVYDVCVEVDGIIYSIRNVAPSGTVNEFYMNNIISHTIENNSIHLDISGYSADIVNFSSVRVITSNGETFVVNEADWVYDADYNVYSYTVESQNDFEYVDVYVSVTPTKNYIESVPEYQGSAEKEFTERFYK